MAITVSGTTITFNDSTTQTTAWTGSAGGVTSLVAGNGITVSSSTGAVTVSQNIYTGTSSANTSFPVGTYLCALKGGSVVNITQTTTVYGQSTNDYYTTAANSPFSTNIGPLAGTWNCRGRTVSGLPCEGVYGYVVQRTA